MIEENTRTTRMSSFSKLPVWNNNSLGSFLEWYKQVETNKRPAKYLISKKIPVYTELANADTDELWILHATKRKEFNQLWKKIKQSPEVFDAITVPNQSLMDLNVELVNRMLTDCDFCQWNCNIDRTKPDQDPNAKTGTCQLGETSRVGSYFHHRGEELIYRGTNGSGTIFFTSCNMRCNFCQNGNISKDKNNGVETTPNELAAISWLLRMEGCHNINYVGGNPTIHLHTIVRSIAELDITAPSSRLLSRIKKTKSDSFIPYPINTQNGDYKGHFNVPLLWNDNFFMSEKTMYILQTLIDIWLPDFKFGPDKKCATRLSRTPWYWETITRNHKMIYDWGEDFTIRHLLMPNHIECCTFPIFDWIKRHIPKAPINIMDQYHPDVYTNPNSSSYDPRYKDINRRITQNEFERAIDYALELDLEYETVTKW